MKRLLVAALSFALINLTVPALSVAAAECPPELTKAKAALQKAQQALKRAQAANVPAPRGAKDRPDEGVPVPRGAGVREDEIQAPRVKKARALVRQADQACKNGDLTLSAQKSKEALELLK